MVFKSKVVKQWTKKDFVKTILSFVLHFLIISLLFALAVFVSENGYNGFIKFFSDYSTCRGFIYLIFSLLLIMIMIYLYFFYELRDFLLETKNIALIFFVVGLSLISSFLIGKYLNVYARPVATCGLLLLLLVNRRTAILFNFVVNLLMFMLDVFTNSQANTLNTFASLIIGCLSGVFAVYLVSNQKSRLSVFFVGFIISIPIIISIIFLEFQSANLLLMYVVFGFTSGMSSVIIMMTTLPFIEFVFNIITQYKLAEITDHSSKLIKILIKDAPGTFYHSLAVSNLAESCANAIGQSSLLARAAAYYHDIGKLKQPEYFSENQTGINLHNDLAPELSTGIIKSHTKDGYELIKKYHLPQIIADVAREHHGTLPIKYFYAKALKFTEGELDVEDFSYEGPIPSTKIAAIIMICDGCEAAVRALHDRSQDKVEQVVRSIIEERMQLGQFNDCELTMKDIEIIRLTITQSLAGVYHDRVKYPKLKITKNNYSSSYINNGEGDK